MKKKRKGEEAYVCIYQKAQKHIPVFIPVNKMHPQLSIKKKTATLQLIKTATETVNKTNWVRLNFGMGKEIGEQQLIPDFNSYILKF